MAVDPEQIAAITRNTVDLYRAAEQQILQLVTRYLRDGIDGPTWADDRLNALAALRRAAADVLRRLDADAPEHIVRAAAEAYRAGDASLLRELPEGLAERLAAARAATIVPRTGVIESLAAALARDVGERHSNVLRHVLDVYRSVIAQATAVSVAGGQTRRQAAQFAYARLVDQGLTSFTDVRGRRWRLSSYVEMAVRTVTQRAAVQGQTDRQQRLGLDLVLVSDSPRECARCRPWEGKVLAISGAQRGRVEMDSMVGPGTVTVDIAGTVDEARADGLMHPNCTHSLRAYLPGATRRPPRPTANPAGYDAKDRQRAIERHIRHWKERETAALDDVGQTAARTKVRQWQAAMRQHLAANPELKRLPYREQIGAGSTPR
ncbi:phage capsid protein [Micromonospora sp. LHW51205]|uniref:phage minor capsid protein n=1 Tax=Micromonospora sp. LHW51205 TaxID=2248752 RepID=UPI000DEAEE03|nr:phage minor capsid protein [Micromonospora sp. LHW51205]RBQ05160.1 phage capsid protein [Micromonospora sp. LHW51205]